MIALFPGSAGRRFVPVGRAHAGPWPGMGAAVATAVAAMTPVFGVAALAAPVERGAGVSGTAVGLALSGFFAVTALGAGVARRVVARLSLPVSLMVANLLAAVSLLLASAARGPVWLVVALLVGGAANTLPQPAAGRYIAVRVPRAKLSLATGLVGAALGAAPLLPGLLAGLVAGPFGWRTALMAASLVPLAALCAVPLSRTGPDGQRVDRTPQAAEVVTGRGDGQRSTRRVLVLWTAAAALATVGSNSAASYFVQIGTDSGLSAATAGLMMSFAGVLAVAVRLAVGVLADRVPRHAPVVVMGMMFSGAVGLACTALGTPVAFVVGAVLAVAGGWGWTGLLLAAVMRLLDGQGARAGAWVQVGLFTGAAVTPFAFGAVSGVAGIPVTVLLAAASALAGTVTMGIGVLLRPRG